tara:strand:- start:640 stop:2721 length:2082 start_codon:yes stop_codon:yes gene_type:complete
LLPEPRWFNALSIAKFCSDSEKAIHKLSKDHPDYDPGVVEQKIQHILGPHSCEKFEEGNPGGCDGCPFKGKITSPIVLGKKILREEEEKEEEEEEDVDLSRVPLGQETKLPKLPEPFFRAANGGLYMHVSDDEPAKLVYENIMYVVNRMTDPTPAIGDVAVLRVHMPKDGVREFIIPNIKISEPRELRKELAKHGILAPESQSKLISKFVLDSVKRLQDKRRANLMRAQFGWADNDTKFIVGDREITATGVHHAPASSVTEDIVPYFEPRGTLEEWKKVWKLYGRKGMEMQAFIALTGFGSPLLKFTEQKGIVLNLVHSLAGTGKTTVLRMVNSVCGNPELLLGTKDDTQVGKILKVGILNNIANTIDEMTNLDGAELSSVLYAFSQGKGKERGEAATNKLRINNTTWRSFTVSSSNASFQQKLTSTKTTPDGELMRLLEFKTSYTKNDKGENIISTQEGKDLFDHTLNNNYGHAIVPFMQWVIGNLEETKVTLRRVQRRIDAELGLTQRERTWSAAIAANITGGLIAERLGLLPDWDIGRIHRVVTPKLLEMREDSIAPVSSASAVVGEYLNTYSHNMLVVDSAGFPLEEPRGELLHRYEQGPCRLFITAGHFKRYCGDFQIDYKDTLKELEKRHLYLSAQSKRLSTGMKKHVTTPVHCLVFDTSHPDFISMEPLVESIKARQDDESREDNV